ncbi:hypothetical protein CEE69_05345 [Rhodopirellula bahusiensis]|uniref:Uncharacterized protein n=1 Tax=Rhodopirellula bahusiensis TaxID=2014065 RepID=A0A2G1WBB4_9BACT|nr:hypothetical protein CEE69_05345 [Rhodopirellula bahusiensis]
MQNPRDGCAANTASIRFRLSATKCCVLRTGHRLPPNGRFLRHRPKRSERRLNYERFYQRRRRLPTNEGVPKASA